MLRSPQLLYYQLEENVIPKADWLQRRLNLTDAELKKVFLTQLHVVGNRFDDMDARLAWYQTNFCLDDDQLRRKVLTRSGYLSYSLEKLEQNLQFLKDRLALERKDVPKFAYVIQYSESRVEEKLAWLRAALGITDKQSCQMVVAVPSIISSSIENKLEPTLQFFAEVLGDKPGKTLLVEDPRIFTYSLEKRIRARFEELQNIGVDLERVNWVILTRYTPEKWAVYLERRRQEIQDGN